MPYIYRPKKSKQVSDKKLLRSKLYNNKKWRKLRDAFLMEHPICAICGKELATDVHHLSSPFDDGLSDIERIGRLLSPSNLQALCKTCHGVIHGLKKNTPNDEQKQTK